MYIPRQTIPVGMARPQDGARGFARERRITILGKDDRRLFELSPAAVTELHQFVARRVSNFADAADIAQQTLLLACAEISTCRGGNLSRWLFTIARHLIVDHYRAENRFRFVEVLAALEETESALQTPADSVLAVAECRERLRLLLECITHRICLERQVALLLADVYGHCDKYSAAVLRMSLPCFKLLLHGARARLRALANAHEGGKVGPCNFRPPLVHPAHRLGVTCHLDASQLFALRMQLVQDLKLEADGLHPPGSAKGLPKLRVAGSNPVSRSTPSC